ncbi:10788_t:CDS:1, partial [Acaulospora morrowiae]
LKSLGRFSSVVGCFRGMAVVLILLSSVLWDGAAVVDVATASSDFVTVLSVLSNRVFLSKKGLMELA